MESIKFYKMSGSGNDFILIDNRNQIIDINHASHFAEKVCRRKMSAGADGLILLENSKHADFQWRFFNSDGSLAEMCGNGARCAARFAFLNGIARKDMIFKTDAGLVEATVSHDLVKIKMTDPSEIEKDLSIQIKEKIMTMDSVNTGVPHVVISVPDVNHTDVVSLGKEIRYHERFSPAGTNVNFITPGEDKELLIRTYERGVEGETLACGTGSVASALTFSDKTGEDSPIKLRTRSGSVLNIYFSKQDGKFFNVFLEGDARIIYKGEFSHEAWQYA